MIILDYFEIVFIDISSHTGAISKQCLEKYIYILLLEQKIPILNSFSKMYFFKRSKCYFRALKKLQFEHAALAILKPIIWNDQIAP